ncbi:MAG: hypothetical protein V1926_04275 [Candidatus Peregrinibacteria bacterium]
MDDHLTIFGQDDANALFYASPYSGEDPITVIKKVLPEIETRCSHQAYSSIDEGTQQTLVHYRRILGKVEQTSEVEDCLRRINAIIRAVRNVEVQGKEEVEFDEITSRLSNRQLQTIGRNVAAVQLNLGCSIGCPDCNFNALLQPRKRLSWKAATTIIDTWGASMKENGTLFYYASDPLDWETSDGHTYLDLLNYCKNKIDFSPHTTTAVPKGKEEMAKQIWESPHEIRISVSKSNIARLKRAGFMQGNNPMEYHESLGEPGHPRSHVIGSGMVNSEESFWRNFNEKEGLKYDVGRSYDYRSYRPSIGCINGVLVTPDGMYNMASTATTPLTPNGFIRYPITTDTEIIFKYKSTQQSNRNHFAPHPVEMVGPAQQPDELFDDQCLQLLYEEIEQGLRNCRFVSLPDEPERTDKRNVWERMEKTKPDETVLGEIAKRWMKLVRQWNEVIGPKIGSIKKLPDCTNKEFIFRRLCDKSFRKDALSRNDILSNQNKMDRETFDTSLQLWGDFRDFIYPLLDQYNPNGATEGFMRNSVMDLALRLRKFLQSKPQHYLILREMLSSLIERAGSEDAKHASIETLVSETVQKIIPQYNDIYFYSDFAKLFVLLSFLDNTQPVLEELAHMQTASKHDLIILHIRRYLTELVSVHL